MIYGKGWMLDIFQFCAGLFLLLTPLIAPESEPMPLWEVGLLILIFCINRDPKKELIP